MLSIAPSRYCAHGSTDSGTSQPNIQRLQGTGRIQVELPGADNPERVRKLLQGVAKLEFLDVADWSETAGRHARD